MKHNKIDNLLREWGQNVTPASAGEQELKAKILSEIDRRNISLHGSRRKNIPLLRRPQLYVVAASLAFIASASYLFIFHKVSQPQSAEQIPELHRLPSISQDEIEEIKIIKFELDKLFDQRVLWISKSAGSLEIKVADSDVAKNNGSNEKILLRHTLLKKDSQGYQTIKHADIIASPNEQILFAGDAANGFIWTYEAAPDVFATDGEFEFAANGRKIPVSYSCGQTTNTPLLINTVKDGNSEYYIYQTVLKI